MLQVDWQMSLFVCCHHGINKIVIGFLASKEGVFVEPIGSGFAVFFHNDNIPTLYFGVGSPVKYFFKEQYEIQTGCAICLHIRIASIPFLFLQ